MLVSPLELQFICSLLGCKVPCDPIILARMMPGIYEISKELKKGTKVPAGYAVGNAVNTSPYVDLGGAGYDKTPSEFRYANVQTPGPLSPALVEMLDYVRGLPDMQPPPFYGGPASDMQPPQYNSNRDEQTQLERDYLHAPRGYAYAQHLASAAPVNVDYPAYANMGGGYNLINAIDTSTVPPNVRYGAHF